MLKEELAKLDGVKELTQISESYFGYLVGQIREVLEASVSDKTQLKALTGVMCDRLYAWWRNANKEVVDNENIEDDYLPEKRDVPFEVLR